MRLGYKLLMVPSIWFSQTVSALRYEAKEFAIDWYD